MPRFNYQARDNSGVAITGEVVARSQVEAIRQLRSEGKFVARLAELDEVLEAAAQMPTLIRSRVKVDEVIYFANQLAGMVETGVPIADALEATIEKAPPGAFRSTVEDLIRRVQSGQEFSAALGAHPKVFPPLFVHMVRASEATGTLGLMLNRVADYLVNQRDIRKKIKGALTYPICMLFFATGVLLFLVSYVLPNFTKIYAGKDAVLPLPTRVVLGISEWTSGHWIHLLVGMILAGVGTVMFFRSPRGRITGDWLRLNLPLIGRMFRWACLARSLRTLGTMISAGVSVLDAVHITRDVVGNRLFARTFDEVYHRLEQGDQLSDALLDAPYFPRPVWQMLRAGERTGKLGPAMQRISDFCEQDLRTSIVAVTQFIEPAMIVIMGIMVGGIALAVLLPIFQISKVMAH